MDIVSTAMNIFGGYYETERGWRHYRVEGKPYDIRFDRSRMEWACDCKAFQFRHKFKQKYCKHIKEVQDKKWLQRVNRIGRAGARVV